MKDRIGCFLSTVSTEVERVYNDRIVTVKRKIQEYLADGWQKDGSSLHVESYRFRVVISRITVIKSFFGCLKFIGENFSFFPAIK